MSRWAVLFLESSGLKSSPYDIPAPKDSWPTPAASAEAESTIPVIRRMCRCMDNLCFKNRIKSVSVKTRVKAQLLEKRCCRNSK